MNQSKFSLADVLSVLAALAFGFVCFMGANFLNIDKDVVWGMPNIMGNIIMAFTYSFALFATAYSAKFLKRTSLNFITSFILEVIMLVSFIFLAFLFTTKSYPFTHFFTVTAKKTEINSKLQASILKAQGMFSTYENEAKKRELKYENELQGILAVGNPNVMSKYGFDRSGIGFDQQILQKTGKLHKDLFPDKYSDSISGKGIKEVSTKWLQNASNIADRWKPIGIVGVVNNIEQKSKGWHKMLESFYISPGEGENPIIDPAPLNYDPLFPDVKAHFKETEYPTLLSIGLALLAYLMIIFTWFVAERDEKGYGVFTTKPYEVKL